MNGQPQHPNLPDYVRGSGIGSFRAGQPITRPLQVKGGDLLVAVSHAFQAINLLRVTSIAPDGSRLYGTFADPENPSRPRLGSDREQCVWDFTMAGGSEYFIALPSNTEKAPPCEKSTP